MNIKIEKSKNYKEKPDESTLGFGDMFTDHMFIMEYEKGKGWFDHRIIPYQDIKLAPSAMVFHYGQEMFEGLKAYRTKENNIQLFRPEKNIRRTNITNDRMCIPQINEDDVLEAIRALVRVDKEWVPSLEGTSLYIRPFIIATDPNLGVRPSETYKFMVILSPVGAYYKEGVNPVSIWVEKEYVRAVKGGVGFAKTGGNYAAGLKAQMAAKEKGYSQVLWLDGVERRYVEEVGTMNVFFKIDGELITPSLEGSILPGVTRDSAITLLKEWGLPVIERRITIDEVYQAAEDGKLEEVFGTGTAAVISPVGRLDQADNKLVINQQQIGPIAKRLYDTITGIQVGNIEDTRGWIINID